MTWPHRQWLPSAPDQDLTTFDLVIIFGSFAASIVLVIGLIVFATLGLQP